MALATTCPQCKTSFKVVPDQLKLRRGLVRCGVCQQVFSGIDYLRYVDDAARGAAAGAAAGPRPRTDEAAADGGLESVDTTFLESVTRAEPPPGEREPAVDAFAIAEPAVGQSTAAEPAVADLAAGEFTAGETAAGESAAGETATGETATGETATGETATGETATGETATGETAAGESTAGERPARAFAPGELAPHEAEPTVPATMDDAARQAATFDRPPAAHAAAGHATASHATADRATLEPADLAPASAGEDAIDFFASERRARGFTSRGAALSWLAAAALASALLVQLAIGARHWLAAWVPPLRPAIAAAFAPLGLAVEPPRDLGALTIESFELQAAGSEGLFAASALLRNAASHPVRWPSMELTLTDGAGAVVVRKVLSPRDYLAGAGADVLDRGIGTGGEFAVRVALQGRDIAPTGYTVHLFYP